MWVVQIGSVRHLFEMKRRSVIAIFIIFDLVNFESCMVEMLLGCAIIVNKP